MEDTIKVKDLISILKGQNPDLHIIIQKDPEGNDYSPVYMVRKSRCKIVECELTGIFCYVGLDIRKSTLMKLKYPEKKVVVENDEALVLVPFI